MSQYKLYGDLYTSLKSVLVKSENKTQKKSLSIQ